MPKQPNTPNPKPSSKVAANSGGGKNQRQHTYKQFDQELFDIRSQVLKLGGLAEEQIELAVKSLLDNDVVLAEQVIRDDRQVNSLEVSIQDQCTQILARRQPAASDLRLIVAVIKAISDLERIGDDAKRIARSTLGAAAHYSNKTRLNPLDPFATHVRLLLKGSLDAFARIDAEAALRVRQSDRQIDREYEDIMQGQIANMMADGRAIPAALHLLWSAKALERIGDRACNICEYVIYYAKGKDIRHMSLEQATKDLNERSD
ncbi:MAG TPA: phosphate signaling complex protein PhoU [Methylococcaceae bacterium]|jgi:phosphate transport system protein|nr:phosphate signaling complex protein PhoU [Methylococcaceae bacterium]